MYDSTHALSVCFLYRPFISMLELCSCSWRTVMPPTESLGSPDCVAQFQHTGRQRRTLAPGPEPDPGHQSTNVLTHFPASVNICVVKIERVIRTYKSVRINIALRIVGSRVEGGL